MIFTDGPELVERKGRFWKESLKKLNVGYQNIESEFTGKATVLSERRYGDRHTMKANVIELDGLNKEVSKYQAQIAKKRNYQKKFPRTLKNQEPIPSNKI